MLMGEIDAINPRFASSKLRWSVKSSFLRNCCCTSRVASVAGFDRRIDSGKGEYWVTALVRILPERKCRIAIVLVSENTGVSDDQGEKQLISDRLQIVIAGATTDLQGLENLGREGVQRALLTIWSEDRDEILGLLDTYAKVAEALN